MHDLGEESLWYALQVAPKRENTVAALLEYKGYEHYVPTYQPNGQRQRTVETAEKKLFPGYVFCKFVYQAKGRVKDGGGVVTTPGIIRILGGVKPVSIPSEEIDAIRRVLSARLRLEPCPFQIGQKVKIEAGPLRGISGIVIRSAKKHRLVLSLELLQRSVAATVKHEWICPVPAISKALDDARASLSLV
jgi:transcription antitermination factor NusG